MEKQAETQADKQQTDKQQAGKQPHRLRPARRYRYTENYKMTMRTLADGTVKEEAEYVGKWLQAEHSADVYKKARFFAVPASVFSLCAGILLLAVQGFAVYNGGLYALIPAAMALFPAIYLLLGALKLPAEDRKLQTDVFRFAHERIRRSSAAIAILYALTLVLTIVFLAVSKAKPGAMDLLYFVLAAGTPVINLLLLHRIKSLKYH